MNNNFSKIIEFLNTLKFNENELETIVNICNKKLKESTDEYYKNEIYNLINNLNNNLKIFIHSFKNITFYEKFLDSMHSYNILFKYEHFNVTLSYRIAYCSEFGGVSMENNINIVDINQETCYNLWGNNMFSRFINILNLDATHEEIKEMLTLMFKAYQPDENIKW
jgi:hypothetical protein